MNAVFLLFWFTTLVSSQPGIEVFVGQSALSEINTLVAELLPTVVNKVHVPDQSGEGHIPALGKFDWTLSNIQIKSFVLGQTNTAIAPTGIVETIKNTGTIELVAEYHWKHASGIIHYSDHGSVDMTIDGVGFQGLINVGEKNGRPTVATPGVQFHLSNLHLKFHGKVSWIYDFLEAVIHPIILREINSRVPDAINKAINVDAENALQNMPVQFPWQNVLFDLSLVAPPTFVPSNYFQFSLKGAFEDKEHPQACPYSPVKLPPSLNSDMLQIYISDSVPNCALNSLYTDGKFKHIISQQSVPAAYQKFLNTSEYWLLLPPLYNAYPNLAMEIAISAARAPSVSFQAPNISGGVDLELQFYVLNGSTPIEAFSLSAALDSSFEIAIKPTNILYGSIQALACNISLSSSNIGPLNIIPLVDAILEPMCNAIPGIANSVLSQGFPIPSELGFTLVDPVIAIGKGFAGISSSIKYSKPFLSLTYNYN